MTVPGDTRRHPEELGFSGCPYLRSNPEWNPEEGKPPLKGVPSGLRVSGYGWQYPGQGTVSRTRRITS
jgi:hypothetical protein